MEYKIFKYMRHNFKIPFFIRLTLAIFLVLFSIIPILLPLFPWSLFIWIAIFVFWLMLVIPWKKIRTVIKIRKWILYFFKNFHKKDVVEYKIRDFKLHIKDILNDKGL